MIEVYLELLRHGLTLIFGLAVSALFLNIKADKRTFYILGLFAFFDLTLQAILFSTYGIKIIAILYPVITHLPLLLIYVVILKKDWLASILTITTAYLCCQIANWFSTIPISLNLSSMISDSIYILTLAITFIVLSKYAAPAFRSITQKGSFLIEFSAIPIFYYIFDYFSTVYTDLLYSDTLLVAEFAPFTLSITYITFCIVYIQEYREKEQAKKDNQILKLQQEHSKKEIEAIRRNEQQIALLKHDLRHFLANISGYIEDNELEKAQNYIRELIDISETTERKKYCANDTVNLILSSYSMMIEEYNIQFNLSLNIPSSIPISDIDITSILSNGLENAINAVKPLKTEERIIKLKMITNEGKLFISIENTFGEKPIFLDGLPQSTHQYHGFGTKSIKNTVEKLHGNCHFTVKQDYFILQIVL